MQEQDFRDEELEPEEPEPWRPPARCLQCGSTQTRLVTMNYEIPVYECDVCGVQFESDD